MDLELLNKPDNIVGSINVNPPTSVVEDAFLGVLQGLEATGVGGTAVKLYNDIIQRGKTSDVTEKDLSPYDISGLRKMVMSHSQANNITEGKIDYPDYIKHGDTVVGDLKKQVVNSDILGGFSYKIEDGNIHIKDKYDFNIPKDKTGESVRENPLVQAILMAIDPRALAIKIGRDRISDKSGKGIPVNIKIPVEGSPELPEPPKNISGEINLSDYTELKDSLRGKQIPAQHIDLENEMTHFNQAIGDISSIVNPKFDWKKWVDEGPLSTNIEDRTAPEWDTFNAATIMGHPNPDIFKPIPQRNKGQGGQLP